jgi:TRAP-type C4-dicarboxylate transport system permease small subunit
LATKEGRHLNIDMVTRFLGDRAKDILRAFTNLFSAFVCLFLFLASVSFVRDEYGFGAMAFGSMPEWFIGLILPFAFSLITLRFSLNFFKEIFAVLRRSFP